MDVMSQWIRQWTVFMALCTFLPCVQGAVFLPINIGILVDMHVPRRADNVTSLPCNITLEWHYADFEELFSMYRTITNIDKKWNDIDIIVLSGYDRPVTLVSNLLKPQNKRFVELPRHASATNQTQIEQLILQYASSSFNSTTASRRGEPYCAILQNESHVENTPMSRLLGGTITTTPPLILVHLVASQKLEVVSVLHDSLSEQDARLFLDQASRHGTVFTVYNVDEPGSLHEKLFVMYQGAMKIEQTINFVVICRLDCLIKVFDTANKFDGMNKEHPSLLKQFSRWLAVVYDYNSNVSSLLQTVTQDLNNVVIIPVPEIKPSSEEEIISSIRELPAKLYLFRFTNQTEQKEFYLKRIAQELVQLDPTSVCTHYLINTLIWTKKGREFVTVGHANLDGEVDFASDPFPNTKYGYSGRPFRIVTETYEPYVSKWTNENNETVFGGIYIDLVAELSRVLNFTYTIVLSPDKKFGAVDKTVNGTDIFNGMVGMLQRHEVDFAAAPLTIIPVRDKVVDFSYPVSYEYTTIIVKKPDPNALKWRTLLNPFKLEVLLYIGLSLPIVTVLVFLLEKFGAFYRDQTNAEIRKETGGLHHLHDAFWYMYGALLCQGGIRLPDSFAGRTYVSAWWIFCIIIVGTYCGNLIAFLTVTKVIAPFNTIEEMLSVKGQYEWGTQGGTVWETIFTTSKNPSFRRIGESLKEFNATDPTILHPDEEFHKERVKQGNYGWIVDSTTSELFLSSACDLTSIKEKVLPMKDAFAFQKNSPHTVLFSQQRKYYDQPSFNVINPKPKKKNTFFFINPLLICHYKLLHQTGNDFQRIMKAQEAGLFEIWRRKWWPKTNFCASTALLQAKPITLLDVQSAFYVCLVGVFFGTLAFGVETAVHRWRNRRQQGSQKSSAPQEIERDVKDNRDNKCIKT